MVVCRSHRFVKVLIHLGLAETLKGTARRNTTIIGVHNKVIVINSVFRHIRTVLVFYDVTLDFRESSRHDWRDSCNSVNEIEADCQQDSNNCVCLCASFEIVSWCKDTIFPNNVCWLGRALELHRLTKQGLVSFQLKGKDARIFLFKSNKGSRGSS